MNVKRELITGTLAGATILGLGGRVVMHIIAITTARPPLVTVQGTINVTLFGTGSGIIGAIIHLLLIRYFRWGRAWREALFLIVLELITLRGLSGQMVPAALLFIVTTALYWGVMVLVSHRGDPVG